MRRQGGQYGDVSANSYVVAQMQHLSGQRMETNSGGFEGRLEAQMQHMPGQRVETNSGSFEDRLEAFTPERDNPYPNSNPDGQRRWEMDGSNMPNSMTTRAFNEGQGGDASRSYFQDQRSDPKLAFQKQSSNDPRTQSHEEDLNAGYERNHLSHSFEGLEQKFLDEIIKLAKEQNDAEDSENARHREKINAINVQYEEKLAELRAQHASRRDEFLQRESHARQQQYQQKRKDPHTSSSMAPSRNPHGYSPVNASAAIQDVRRGYSADDRYDPYRERARFLGSTRDHGLEPRVPYPGGRVYDTGSRYYN